MRPHAHNIPRRAPSFKNAHIKHDCRLPERFPSFRHRQRLVRDVHTYRDSLSSRARYNLPLRMRIAAVLLLIITLPPVVVEAAPVWTNPTIPNTAVSVSDVTTSARNIGGRTSLGGPHASSSHSPSNNNAPTTRAPSRDHVRKLVAHLLQLLRRENKESVILERGVGMKAAFHVCLSSVFIVSVSLRTTEV